jgi:hypothetical protein
MLSFLKKIFGSAPAVPEVPYKVEAPVAEASKPVKTANPKVAKKPAVKAKTARKPKGPKPD